MNVAFTELPSSALFCALTGPRGLEVTVLVPQSKLSGSSGAAPNNSFLILE